MPTNPLQFTPEQIKALQKLNKQPTKAQIQKKQRADLLDALVEHTGAKTRAERRKIKSNLRRILKKQPPS